jgi:PE family
MDMSYVTADPELMTAAASDLASIGSNVSAAHMVAAARTVAVIPAAADEVSAGIAQLFSQHAQDYQALAAQAAAFHEDFVHHLGAGAASYSSIEASIASFLHDVNSSVDALGSFITSIASDSGFFVRALAFLPVVLLLVIAFIYIVFLIVIGHGLTYIGLLPPI